MLAVHAGCIRFLPDLFGPDTKRTMDKIFILLHCLHIIQFHKHGTYYYFNMKLKILLTWFDIFLLYFSNNYDFKHATSACISLYYFIQQIII